mmetsp:Transcript_51367/g.123159  ORF Transcript_51367/g.123159 Transcript_51367/m.123159 type:complete len:334 (+) Transcript_51367:959-1960(+)
MRQNHRHILRQLCARGVGVQQQTWPAPVPRLPKAHHVDTSFGGGTHHVGLEALDRLLDFLQVWQGIEVLGLRIRDAVKELHLVPGSGDHAALPRVQLLPETWADDEDPRVFALHGRSSDRGGDLALLEIGLEVCEVDALLAPRDGLEEAVDFIKGLLALHDLLSTLHVRQQKLRHLRFHLYRLNDLELGDGPALVGVDDLVDPRHLALLFRGLVLRLLVMRCQVRILDALLPPRDHVKDLHDCVEEVLVPSSTQTTADLLLVRQHECRYLRVLLHGRHQLQLRDGAVAVRIDALANLPDLCTQLIEGLRLAKAQLGAIPTGSGVGLGHRAAIC